MGCATGIVRFIVFAFNLVFALAGLALLIVGVLFKLNVDEVANVTPDNLELAPTLLIIVGSIIFVIAFFGCCGAVRESTCMLTTYAVILLIIFVLQVAVAVFAFLQIKDPESLRDTFKQNLIHTFDRRESDPLARETVNIIQRSYHCCGVLNPSEMIFTNKTYWPSCCANDTVPCTTPFESGCFELVFNSITNAVKIIGIVAISVAAIEVFGAIAALCLSSSIKNQYRRGAYA